MGDLESDSDYSDSSDSITSSKSSGESNYDDGDTELAIINNVSFRLPRSLCEDSNVFKEFFSINTWRDLPNNFQAYLKNKFLPQFPANNEAEQETTLRMLLNDENEIQRFDMSPLEKFQKALEDGGYRPDVLKLRVNLDRFRRRERRYQKCERISQLSKSLLVSREKLLRAAYNSPPESTLKKEEVAKYSIFNQNIAVVRAQRRFQEEVVSITKSLGIYEFFDDWIMDNAMDENLASQENQTNSSNEHKIIGTMCRRTGSLKRNSIKGATQMNDSNLRDILLSHKRRKLDEPDRPEYETNDIRLRDVHARTQLSGTYRKLHSKTLVKKSSLKLKQRKVAIEPYPADTTPLNEIAIYSADDRVKVETPNKLEEKICPSDRENDEEPSPVKLENLLNYIRPLNEENQKKQSKVSPPMAANVATKVLQSVKMTEVTSSSHKKLLNELNVVEMPSVSQQSEIVTNVTPKVGQYHGKVTVATVSDLEGIDMMRLPVDLEEDGHLNQVKGPNEPKRGSDSSALMQDTHICFFSLIRDIFCSTSNHRIKLGDLTDKVCTWLSNPITALNDWYSNADNWLALIPSAIHFLAGDFSDQPEDFVPYLEYKANLDIYQWIGAGRDSDQHLLQLYNYWLSRRNEMNSKPVHNFDQNTRKLSDMEDLSSHERPISPPPPKCPTMWVVQPYTFEEFTEFRIQEKHRFENPHRAFTYRMHGYESVVGPVKGIYTQIYALSKARGHTMLVADRPNFVTILTLVRDATARLPNGEGTRADICELLKSSQYINPQAQDSILQTIVSGALDRMHTEHDPCVRYDPKRKIWIYLHRNRTEEEFERLHQQYQGIGKHKKTPNRKLKQKISNKQILTGSEEAIAVTSIKNAIVTTKPLPTLSSIQQPTTHAITSNNANHISLKISPKGQIKPELVPIKTATLTAEKPEADASFSTENRPVTTSILQRTSNFHMLPTLIVDTNVQKFTPRRNVAQGTSVLNSSLSNATSVSTTVQTTSSSPSNAVFDPKSLTSTLTTPTVVQPVTNFKTQFTLPDKRQVKVISTIESNTAPAIQQATAVSQGQGYVLPISLSNSDQIKPTISSTIATLTSINNKVRTNQAQIVTNSGSFKQSLMQPTAKNFLRVSSTTAQAGKSLISPHVAVTNITLQQQQKLLSNLNSSNSLPQQRVGQVSLTPGRQQSKATLVNSVKPQHHIAVFNQKQNVQSIIASGGKTIPRQSTINLQKAVMIPSSQIPQGSLQGKQVIISSQGGLQQLQKVIITSGNGSVATSTITVSPANVVTSQTASSSLINPQIIRIQQTGQLAGAKLQTINASDLTQQEQAVFQSIKKQQQKLPQTQPSNQHSLIVKQQPVFQQMQRQGTISTSAVVPCTVVNSSVPKAMSTTLAASVRESPNPTINQTFISQQVVNTTKLETITSQTSVTKPSQTVTRVIKSGTSIIHPHTLTNFPGLPSQGETPVMTKVLTNNPGQIISLESLMQKQGNSATLRIAGTKPNQANVLQIGTPGSQITQYAVVSQGRNIISVAAPQRMIATHAGTTGTNLGGKVAEHNLAALNTGTGQSQSQNTTKTITTNQIQSISAQQLMSAKVLSKTSSGSIRMVNASNLNIAHIRGKPVIIASKPANVSGQQANQSVLLQNPINSTPVVIGAQTLKLQGNVITPANVQVLSQSSTAQAQTVVLGNQIIKVQQAMPLKSQSTTPVTNIISNSSVNSTAQHLETLAGTNPNTVVVNSNSSSIGTKTVVLSSTGQTLRVQPSTAINVQTGINAPQSQPVLLGTTLKGVSMKGTNTGQQRVVLAVQGGGQIILPAGFQGGAINLKSMQGLKVVSVTQQQNKGK